MRDKESRALYLALGFTIVICLWLLVCAAIWGVWINVVPAVWPDGPLEITQPDYLVFAGSMLLLKVFSGFFRRKD